MLHLFRLFCFFLKAHDKDHRISALALSRADHTPILDFSFRLRHAISLVFAMYDLPRGVLNLFKGRLAAHLIRLESENPGVVRLQVNPFLVSFGVDLLSKKGLHKKLFQSPKQFLIDSFLTHQCAAEALLEYSMLVGPHDSEGRTFCWDGFGQYCGWQSPVDATSFSSSGKMRLIFLVNAVPFCTLIDDIPDFLYFKNGSSPEMVANALGAMRESWIDHIFSQARAQFWELLPHAKHDSRLSNCFEISFRSLKARVAAGDSDALKIFMNGPSFIATYARDIVSTAALHRPVNHEPPSYRVS